MLMVLTRQAVEGQRLVDVVFDPAGELRILRRPLGQPSGQIAARTIPRIIPEPRYFLIPSTVVGCVALRNEALNWTPCVRSLTQVPLAWTNSPAEIIAACPRTVIRSRWPRALTRSTQKPFSSL